MTHMMEAIPENAESMPAASDGFARWIADESAGHVVTVGDVNTVGHMTIARDVTAAEIAAYVAETGDAFVSDAVRSGVRPGHVAVVTDSQGFVYGYMLADDAAAEATLTAAETIEAEFEDAVEEEPANAPRELAQVCNPCAQLIANGEAYQSHEDVSDRYNALQVAKLGADAGHVVLASCDGEDDACRNGECDCEPHEAIGTCDACGTEPVSGYWFAQRAVIIR